MTLATKNLKVLKSKKVLFTAGVVAILVLGAIVTSNLNKKIEQKQRDLQQTSKRLNQIEREKNELEQGKQIRQEKIKQLEQEKQQLNSEKESLNQQLSKKREQMKLASAVSISKPVAASPAPVRAISGSAKAFIYMKESGNNPNATNAQGCYGIGQDCNGIVKSKCGANYACQDAYFSSYANSRYGGWDGALAAWQSKHWW